MVPSDDRVSFPVVFCDGECESNIGVVVVYPTLEFKRFQSELSQMIGISPHQFSVYLSSQETRRRIPITGKFNFGAISSEKGCFFLVVLKRSRRERRRRSPLEIPEDVYFTSSMKSQQPIKKSPPDNVMLLRRGTGISQDPAFSGFMVPYADRVEYEERVRELELERKRYLMNMGVKGMALANKTGTVREKVGNAVCNLCLRAKETGREAEFHHCVYDTVTYDFRSRAGPIGRPVKGSEYT
ncbi:hypothetical protein FNV43_RR16657 [Rhamnella rubrinervis]|uniref:DUF7138 domain-containing protein n=1 Tax=Rhamnella rubrinervis TaxID=2594499 RepID=A0A8K0GZ88_9ROSA|nr:hypothetical protein FNV43_RR16657 [Rhamnella rubrinervis]